MFDMAASPCIQCRIDPQIKLRLQVIAIQRGLTESAVLKRESERKRSESMNLGPVSFSRCRPAFDGALGRNVWDPVPTHCDLY